MKHIFFFLILIAPQFSFAQKAKAVVLKSTDPIIGNWKLDTTAGNFGLPALLYDGDGTEIIDFQAGQATSYAAFLMQPGDEIACPSSFVAKSDGKKIYGKITDSCAVDEVGNSFEFEYRYDKEKDQLVITVNGQEYHFKRDTTTGK
jgi:hypothetical protein